MPAQFAFGMRKHGNIIPVATRECPVGVDIDDGKAEIMKTLQFTQLPEHVFAKMAMPAAVERQPWP